MRNYGSSEKNLFLILADVLEMMIVRCDAGRGGARAETSPLPPSRPPQGFFVCLTDVSRRIAHFLKKGQLEGSNRK